MSAAELTTRIGCLATEADRVEKRIERLRRVPERPPEEICRLEKLLDRLRALQEAAREQLAEEASDPDEQAG